MLRRLLIAVLLLAGAAGGTAQQPPAYLFSYFTGNGEDGLHFLSSTDGLTWSIVGGGRSFLRPAIGSRLMRDPSIARGPDGTFHLVWTTGWWDKGIGIAHSKDLIEWSEQTFVPVGEQIKDAINCWAPEIFFDGAKNRFLIVWASSPLREPNSEHRLYFVETADFKRYTPVKKLFDEGFSVIDGFIVRSPRGYALVMKDERALPEPKKNLRVAEAAQPEGPYGSASPPISVDWVEGPSVIKKGDGWLMYYDEYTRKKYGAMRSTDLKQWTPIENFSLPAGVRHGTAFEVPSGVLAKLAASK